MPKPTLSNALAGNKAPEQIALGDAAKMATQLNMRIEAHTWVKEIQAAQHQLILEKDGQQSNSALCQAGACSGCSSCSRSDCRRWQ